MHVCTQQGLSHLDYCLWVTRAQVLKQDSSEKFHEETRMFHYLTTHYTSSPFVTEILYSNKQWTTPLCPLTLNLPHPRPQGPDIFSCCTEFKMGMPAVHVCMCVSTCVHSCVCACVCVHVHACACVCACVGMNFLQIAQRWQEFVFRFSHRGHLRTHKKRRRQKSEWNYYVLIQIYVDIFFYRRHILNNSFIYVYICTG